MARGPLNIFLDNVGSWSERLRTTATWLLFRFSIKRDYKRKNRTRQTTNKRHCTLLNVSLRNDTLFFSPKTLK